MPRPKGTGKGATEVVTIRMEMEVAAFYRGKANEAGLSLAEFIRQTLMAGITAESLTSIEARLGEILDKASRMAESVNDAKFPHEAWKTLFMTEAMLTKIVESRKPSDLYEAQEMVKKRLLIRQGE